VGTMLGAVHEPKAPQALSQSGDAVRAKSRVSLTSALLLIAHDDQGVCPRLGHQSQRWAGDREGPSIGTAITRMMRQQMDRSWFGRSGLEHLEVGLNRKPAGVVDLA
jgi:hypothetical protein